MICYRSDKMPRAFGFCTKESEKNPTIIQPEQLDQTVARNFFPPHSVNVHVVLKNMCSELQLGTEWNYPRAHTDFQRMVGGHLGGQKGVKRVHKHFYCNIYPIEDNAC